MKRLIVLALLALWANSALARDEEFCDVYQRHDLGEGEEECRVDLSAPAPPVPDPIATPPQAKFRELRSPPATVVVDVCTAWNSSTEPTVTLAEIEYGRADGLSGAAVLVLSAARVAGQDVLLVDWISAAPDNWTLAGTSNVLPSAPVDLYYLAACSQAETGRFTGPRITIRVDQKKVVIAESNAAKRALPLKSRLPGDPLLVPRSLRVSLFRNAGLDTGVVSTRWSQPDGRPVTTR